MSRSATFRRYFQPRFETLEPRRCLAAFVKAVGTSLLIRGDEADNQIAVVDEGAAGVSVSLDGGEPVTFAGARQIILQTGGGNDSVQLALGGPDTRVGKLSASLGAGDDVLDLSLSNLGGKALAVSVSGDSGQDWLAFHEVDEFTGNLSISASGGDGDDYIAFHEVDEFQGTLSFSASGGNGADEVGIIIVHGLVGTLNVNTSGGSGDDLMYHEVDKPVGKLRMATSGGSGDDVMIHEVDELTGSASLITAGGDGNDQLDHGLTVLDLTGPLAVSSKGGNDNDSLLAHLGFNPQPDPPKFAVQVVLDGGAGSDDVASWLGYQPPLDPAAREPVFAPARSFTVSLKGGAGDDLVDAVFALEGAAPGARLTLRMDGGDGDDIVSAVDVFIGDPNEIGDPNQTILSLLGGNGDDQIALSSFAGPNPELLPWLIDGGAGIDEATFPRGLRTKRCELLLPV